MNNLIIPQTDETRDELVKKFPKLKAFESLRVNEALEVIRVPGGFLWIRNPQVVNTPAGVIAFNPCMTFQPLI